MRGENKSSGTKKAAAAKKAATCGRPLGKTAAKRQASNQRRLDAALENEAWSFGRVTKVLGHHRFRFVLRDRTEHEAPLTRLLTSKGATPVEVGTIVAVEEAEMRGGDYLIVAVVHEDDKHMRKELLKTEAIAKWMLLAGEAFDRVMDPALARAAAEQAELDGFEFDYGEEDDDEDADDEEKKPVIATELTAEDIDNI